MGIQKRLVGSYLIVICLTVLILEIILIFSVRYYYFHNIEQTLMNQAELSASFYQQYFDEEDLEEQSGRLLKGFTSYSNAQVQVINSAGQLLQDSNGMQGDTNLKDYIDIQAAIEGQPGSWRGKDPATGEVILAVSYPLLNQSSTVGEVRFITSLTETINTVNQITILLIGAGLLVIGVVTLPGLFLSWTITRSIKDLKQAADRMTGGNFNIRVQKRYNDELGSLADTFNMMASQISKSEQLKNDFIASVSHELRTPLTSIKGWVITMKAGGAGNLSLFHEGLDIIEAESDRLTHMVDELLDFSKLDNGRITIQPASVDVAGLLKHICRQLTPRATRQGVRLEMSIEENLPVIQADGNRLKQVMINLIDNSLKFTHAPGHILISARTDSGKVIVAVTDTGPGIAAADLDHVRQKFYKADQQAAGSGLGLAIAEQIIKLHHGELRISSTLGKGTMVEIDLPMNSGAILTIS
ncbi:HAMP domain-containing sensor histidine kinase [Paenibacillus sp. MMS20-IR301]|uniref:sensor histidine kinase n=1 Tax=Paenibacillus sp. MMS20-IR301 TaxID=2895946 RepID=UPI0028F0EECA|nr:HAMP domain-containing sensor histidine kinase [Paenibacillus sp. MMS20-IR301]WNS45462.1 HAMP domain-containing sensor histidine kinase [Paenibacillus sp. MMS20-IR301]